MKINQITLIVGVFALVIVIMNWDKLFGKKGSSTLAHGGVGYRRGGASVPTPSNPKGSGPVTTQNLKCLTTNPMTGSCITCKTILPSGSLGAATYHYPNCAGAE